jgi:putative ABC transport system substrate-binding protein
MVPDLNAKSLELLQLVVPGAKRIAVRWSPNPYQTQQFEEIHTLAQTLGSKILPVVVNAPAGLEQAFEKIATERCHGLIVLADFRVTRSIVDLAAKARLPAIYQVSEYAPMGGLLSFSTDIADLWRRAAVYVDRILKGAAPSVLPAEQPTKFELLINLKTATALGVTISDSLLGRADEVIE